MCQFELSTRQGVESDSHAAISVYIYAWENHARNLGILAPANRRVPVCRRRKPRPVLTCIKVRRNRDKRKAIVVATKNYNMLSNFAGRFALPAPTELVSPVYAFTKKNVKNYTFSKIL